MASTTEEVTGLLAKATITALIEGREATEGDAWQPVKSRQKRKSVLPPTAAGGQRPSAYQGPNAHQRSNAYEKPFAYLKSNAYQGRQGGMQGLQNSQAPHAYSQFSRATWVPTYRDVNFKNTFEVGDIVTSFDLSQAFLKGPPSNDEDSGSNKDIDADGQEIKEEKLEQGVASMLMGKKRVEISAKKRPGVIIAIFKERMTVVYMFTHGNQGWRATDRKPQEYRDAAFYLTTDKARMQSYPGDGFEAYPGTKRLLWTKTHETFQDKDSVLYVDALSTIYANVVIGAEKKGSLDDESLRRLLSAAREFQIQGSYKPASTKQNYEKLGPSAKAPSAAETADLQAPAMERGKSNQRVTALEATSDAENEQQPAATNDNGPVFHPLSRLAATVAVPKLNLEISSSNLPKLRSQAKPQVSEIAGVTNPTSSTRRGFPCESASRSTPGNTGRNSSPP